MGGINHQPTSQISLALTVPAAEALTGAMADLMLGNCDIERHIQLTGSTHFGVGRQHLIMAAGHFTNAISKLEITKSYVNRVIDMIGNPDYQPFDLGSVEVQQFVDTCIKLGLLPDSAATSKATEITLSSGYTGIFFAINDLIEDAIIKTKTLHATTQNAVDGPEGNQGYFWQNVEANRNSWRTDFMQSLTALTNVITFWSTTAAICTEVHLTGVDADSLVSNINNTVQMG